MLGLSLGDVPIVVFRLVPCTMLRERELDVGLDKSPADPGEGPLMA